MRWLPENCLETISLTIVLDPIIFPAYFNVNGIFTSATLLIISAVVVLHSSQIYTSMMSKKRKNLDEIIGYYLGKKWRLAYLILTLVYILQLVQVYTLYITEFIKDFILSLTSISSQDNYANLLSIAIAFPIIISVMIRDSTSAFKKCLKFNILLILSFIIIYLYILGYSFQEIKNNFDSSLLTSFKPFNLPYFLAQNNYSFHFQIYLQELIVFNSQKSIINAKIQHITIYFTLVVGIFFGTVGSFIVNDKDKLEFNNDDHQSQIYNLLIFKYLQQFPATVVCMKIFMIFNMLNSIGFKFIIFRQNLIKFIVNKKNVQNFNRQHFDTYIKISTIIFLILLNLATTNQQSSFFITVGSVTCFFILYHIPHYLKLAPRKYIITKKIQQDQQEKSQYELNRFNNQISLQFKPMSLNDDDGQNSITQSIRGDLEEYLGNFKSENNYYKSNTCKFYEKVNKYYEIEVQSNLTYTIYKFKYLIGVIVILYGLSTMIQTAISQF